MSFQNALPVPLLQGIDSLPNELPKLLGRVCITYEYILPHWHMFITLLSTSSVSVTENVASSTHRLNQPFFTALFEFSAQMPDIDLEDIRTTLEIAAPDTVHH